MLLSNVQSVSVSTQSFPQYTAPPQDVSTLPFEVKSQSSKETMLSSPMATAPPLPPQSLPVNVHRVKSVEPSSSQMAPPDDSDQLSAKEQSVNEQSTRLGFSMKSAPPR